MVSLNGAHHDGFWYRRRGGQVVLAPHGSTTVTLQTINPRSPFGAPAHGSQWLVEAYTTSPEALSTTPLQLWRLGKAR